MLFLDAEMYPYAVREYVSKVMAKAKHTGSLNTSLPFRDPRLSCCTWLNKQLRCIATNTNKHTSERDIYEKRMEQEARMVVSYRISLSFYFILYFIYMSSTSYTVRITFEYLGLH
jgi:hypothetical protein